MVKSSKVQTMARTLFLFINPSTYSTTVVHPLSWHILYKLSDLFLVGSCWMTWHMGEISQDVQSMKMIYFFVFFGHCLWQFRGLECQEIKHFLKIY